MRVMAIRARPGARTAGSAGSRSSTGGSSPAATSAASIGASRYLPPHGRAGGRLGACAGGVRLAGGVPGFATRLPTPNAS